MDEWMMNGCFEGIDGGTPHTNLYMFWKLSVVG
jgi:hypothetical protein